LSADGTGPQRLATPPRIVRPTLRPSSRLSCCSALRACRLSLHSAGEAGASAGAAGSAAHGRPPLVARPIRITAALPCPTTPRSALQLGYRMAPPGSARIVVPTELNADPLTIFSVLLADGGTDVDLNSSGKRDRRVKSSGSRRL